MNNDKEYLIQELKILFKKLYNEEPVEARIRLWQSLPKLRLQATKESYVQAQNNIQNKSNRNS